MRTTAVTLALALLCACAGSYTSGETGFGDGNGIPFGTKGPDAGDAGDAGPDGGDGGPDAGDAGCTSLSLSNAGVIDGCGGPGSTGTASVSVTDGGTGTCNVTITMTTPTAFCTGTASGPTDAFAGACQGFPRCVSTSLPGTINCGTCAIVICDGGCP